MVELESIWLQYHRRLQAFIFQHVKDRAGSEEILSDVFIKIATRASSIKEEKKLEGWIWQVTRNTLYDYFRKKRRYVDFPEKEMVIDSPPRDSCITASIQHFIKKLPTIYQMALLEVDIHGVPQHQFAKEQNIKYTTAKSRVQRARRLLRKNLEECCTVDHDRYGNILEATPRQGSACPVHVKYI